MINIFAKKDEQIIQSLLDNDLYKMNMQQVVLHQYPGAEAVVEFHCRNSEDLKPYIQEIREQVEAIGSLRFKEDQLWYLGSIRYLKPDYINFLKHFQLDPHHVNISVRDGQLAIRIAGPWLSIIMWEVMLMAIISEIRNRTLYTNKTLDDVRRRIHEKVNSLLELSKNEDLSGFHLADFGTRRRFSFGAQWTVTDYLRHALPDNFVGTSNVHIAREMQLTPIGTQAHEFFMAQMQLGPRLIDSQKAALESWVKEYRGELGIALTDCISMDAFLNDFDLYFAKLFDGLRHDSGDALVWGDKAIAHYKKLRINPMTKTLVFSDGLTLESALNIYRYFKGRINVSFGIGTSLSCDIPGVKPMNMVLKMTYCNGQPVAKLSDSPGKTMCKDLTFVNYLKDVFKYQG